MKSTITALLPVKEGQRAPAGGLDGGVEGAALPVGGRDGGRGGRGGGVAAPDLIPGLLSWRWI